MITRIFKAIRAKLQQVKMKGKSPNELAEYYRNQFYYLGKNVELFTTHFSTEPYLISIHDNVVVAAGVKFITHDYSIANLARYSHKEFGYYDKVGSIELFDNCFIGAYSILMPNTSVGKNSVIAAGSIVTKHVPDDEVWGGEPARFIMTTGQYVEKVANSSSLYPWMPLEKKRKLTKEQIIKLRQDYFFKRES